VSYATAAAGLTGSRRVLNYVSLKQIEDAQPTYEDEACR